jgi:hypothetical protein
VRGDARLKLAFNLARANKAHLSGAYVLAEGNTAPRGPSGFGGVPGMTSCTEEPSPGGAVSEVFHKAEVDDRVELRFKAELRVAGIEGEWPVVRGGCDPHAGPLTSRTAYPDGKPHCVIRS